MNYSNNIKPVKQLLQALFVASFVVVISACATTATTSNENLLAAGGTSADKLMPVDCLLPPKIKKLGSQLTYLEARRPGKLTALECEVRGGEYVAYDRADFRTALNVWLQDAKAGNAQAQTYVGEIFEKGLGVKPDHQAAFQWYTKAAAQNYSRAQMNLGYLYEKGFGVTKDSVKALNLYRQASGMGEAIDYSSVLDDKAAQLESDYTATLRVKNAEIKQLTSSLEMSRSKLSYNQNLFNEQQSRLAQIKKELSVKDQSIATLENLNNEKLAQEKALTKTKQQIVTLEKQTDEATTPVIEVIEPVLLATRGGNSLVASSALDQSQTIKGKISSLAGLQLASINNTPIEIDSQGYFETSMKIDKATEIKIQAIDNSGQSADLLFQLVPDSVVGAKSVARERTFIPRNSVGSIKFGKFYALVIGNDDYANYSNLKTAINDATEVARVLRANYGVETTLLKNANRYTILSSINKLKEKLTKNDNLMIYYAGHGEIDQNTQQGYWLPVDAEQDNSANWIPNSGISDLLNTISAKHVLIVADSCYSGSMGNSSTTRLNNKVKKQYVNQWLKAMSKTRSRTVLTSGGLKPVLDAGSDGHSVFANAFIRELTESKGVIDAYQLYLNINQKVSSRAAAFGYSQIPSYAPIKHAGHAGGEFVLVGG